MRDIKSKTERSSRSEVWIWTVIERAEQSDKWNGTAWWIVECECHNVDAKSRASLINGISTHCEECSNRARIGSGKHNMYKTATYISWVSMKQRCLNPNNPGYDYYGGRGITVCDEWMTFKGFHRSLGTKPKGLTLERIDVDKNYEPSNCKWATIEEQSYNKRSSISYKIKYGT